MPRIPAYSFEERFCFGKGGAVAHRAEQVRHLAERLLGAGIFESE